jgi:ribosomal peptide maturation radical SAM protein 1
VDVRLAAWNERFALVNMPFAAANRPSIGLEAVRAQLHSHGVATRIFYENLAFISRVGGPTCDTIANLGPPHLLLGDWAFHAAAFGGPPRTATEITAVVEDWCARYGLAAGDYAAASAAVTAAQDHAAAFVDEVADRILAWRPGVVGIGASFQLLPAVALARALRRRAPEMLVVLGGSQCHGDLGDAVCRHFSEIDLVCRGEGEGFVDALVRCLRDPDVSLATVPDLVHRYGDHIVVSPVRGTVDLDAAPPHDFSGWFEAVAAVPDIDPGWLVVPFETSRGCWYGEKTHCIFCGLNADDLRFRAKTPEKALAEIRAALAWPARHAAAVDNILATAFFDQVLPEVARWRHGKNLFFEVKSNLTRRQVEGLRAAGVREIQPGIESLSTSLLRQMRKGVTAFQNVRLLRLAIEHEIGVGWNLITFVPGETDIEIDDVISVARRLSHLQPPYSDSCILTVDRFSPLYAEQRRRPSAIAPHAAYRALYGDGAMAEDLATFFEFLDLSGFPADRTAVLRDVIAGWRTAFGSDALFWLREGDRIAIHDFRGEHCEHGQTTVLRGEDIATCWDALQDGAGIAEVRARGSGGAWLDTLIERGIVLAIDGRLLSLAVRLDNATLSPCDPNAAQAGRAAYRSRIERICGHG